MDASAFFVLTMSSGASTMRRVRGAASVRVRKAHASAGVV